MRQRTDDDGEEKKTVKTTVRFRLIRLVTIAAIILLLAQMVLDIVLYARYLSTLAGEWIPNAFWTPEQTKAELLHVIQETLQPEYVSLWLKPTEEPRRNHAK